MSLMLFLVALETGGVPSGWLVAASSDCAEDISVMATAAISKALTAVFSSVVGASVAALVEGRFSPAAGRVVLAEDSTGDSSDANDGMEDSPSCEGVRRGSFVVLCAAGDACFINACS